MNDSLTQVERRVVIGAVMATFFLVALDQTILGAAMPRIIADLHGLNRYGWLTTAYLLTSTVMVPIYGKIADMYGRRIVLLTGISVFLLGSVLCGLSGEFGGVGVLDGMDQLILFRAVQGFGGAALFTSAWVIVADLYPPLQRGRIMGALAGVYGSASVLGPVVGGFLTDHGGFSIAGLAVAGWRTVFYVNVPLGLAALAAIAAWMPKLGGGRPGRLDVCGAALIVSTFVPLLLALTWGGHDYAWTSPQVLGLFGLTVASLATLIAVESRVADPIIPLRLFRNREIARCAAAAFLTGLSFLAYAMFLPLFMQVVQGRPATDSGLEMLPMTLSFVASSVLSGQIVAKTGLPKPIIIGGGVLGLAGVVAILMVQPETGPLNLSLRLVLVGLGMGPAQNLLNLISQTAADRADIGAVTALSQFSRQIGATVGIAVFSTVLAQGLTTQLPQVLAHTPAAAVIRPLTGDTAQVAVMRGPGAVAQGIAAAGLGKGVQADEQARAVIAGLRGAFAAAIRSVFWAAGVFVLLGFLVTLLIPNVVLSHPKPETGPRKADEGVAVTDPETA